MITIYPKEYFLIQIIFAQKICEIKNISFEKAIQDYTNIAQDLLNISKYPPKKIHDTFDISLITLKNLRAAYTTCASLAKIGE